MNAEHWGNKKSRPQNRGLLNDYAIDYNGFLTLVYLASPKLLSPNA